MTNFDYDLRYGDLRYRGRLKFNPLPQLSRDEYESLVATLCVRLLCPRLPRLGERVLTRPIEDGIRLRPRSESTWTESFIAAEGSMYGVQTEAITDDRQTLMRTTYLLQWDFAPGNGPKEVLQ